jgi:phosphoglycolate phosphatase
VPKVNQAILFDLDGTLIDSAPSILTALSHVFKLNDLQPLKQLTSDVIGPPLMQTLIMLSGVSDEKKILQMIGQFKEYYDVEACLLSQPFEGVDEGLKKLVKANFGLHISTNKRLIPTRKILKYLGWDNFFTSVYTLDKNEVPFKSKSEMINRQLKDFVLSVDQVIYVGDRVEDMVAAQKNQINFVGVSWGYGDFPNHVRTINSFSQLNSLVTQ